MKFVQVESSKCGGIRECEKICSKTFFKVEDPSFSSIRVTKTDDGYDINVCNQCGACIEICPVKALSRNTAGTVMVNKSSCVGCFMCIGFCPTMSMRRAQGHKEPFKCVSCGACTRACARACPNGAIKMAEADHSGLPA